MEIAQAEQSLQTYGETVTCLRNNIFQVMQQGEQLSQVPNKFHIKFLVVVVVVFIGLVYVQRSSWKELGGVVLKSLLEPYKSTSSLRRESNFHVNSPSLVENWVFWVWTSSEVLLYLTLRYWHYSVKFRYLSSDLGTALTTDLRISFWNGNVYNSSVVTLEHCKESLFFLCEGSQKPQILYILYSHLLILIEQSLLLVLEYRSQKFLVWGQYDFSEKQKWKPVHDFFSEILFIFKGELYYNKVVDLFHFLLWELGWQGQ